MEIFCLCSEQHPNNSRSDSSPGTTHGPTATGSPPPLLLCWLLADEWFRQAKPKTREVLRLLETESAELAAQVAAKRFVADPDRREELARVALARLGYRPAGETLAQAQDRLTTLNSGRTRACDAGLVCRRGTGAENPRSAGEESCGGIRGQMDAGMNADTITNAEGYPTLTEQGLRMLEFLREQPHAPIFRNESA